MVFAVAQVIGADSATNSVKTLEKGNYASGDTVKVWNAKIYNGKTVVVEVNPQGKNGEPIPGGYSKTTIQQLVKTS